LIQLPYTICFCLRDEQVLMLYRNKSPNTKQWNGLGGKIEPGETPLTSVLREVMEEAEIDLSQAQELRFAGAVTWASGAERAQINGGMYAFLAYLSPDFPIWPDRSTAEGLLSWKPLAWVSDPDNSSVVSNIPHFLPRMLAASEPQEYRCHYQEQVLQTLIVYPYMSAFLDF
jgi:8-oxo-dGTP diphosphatase